jgi:single-strand DNA-binding protein
MAGVNKAILIGNLGRDPEVRYTATGTAVASFPIATTERYNDKNGQRQDRTEWHNIVCWSRLAEICKQYLKKGSSVFIEGRIQTRTWNDRDGNKRYTTEIVAATMQILGSRSGAAAEAAERPAAEPVPPDDFIEGGFKPPMGPGSGPDHTGSEPQGKGPAPEEDLPF